MSLTLTKPQLEQLWIQAGGRPAAAGMAAAIALAESSGRQNATLHDSDGSVDRGYWQINSVHGTESTYNALGNARAAVAISNNGTDWSAWTTYHTGAYIPYLTGQTTSSATPAGASIPGASTATVPSSSSSTTGDAYGGLGGWLLKALLTVTLVGAGLALAGVGARNALGARR